MLNGHPLVRVGSGTARSFFRFTINCDDGVRTDNGAIHATSTCVGVELSKAVPPCIQMVGKPETLLGTGDNAQLASLADVVSDHNRSTNHRLDPSVIVVTPRRVA